jgi:hypothetical protein
VSGVEFKRGQRACYIVFSFVLRLLIPVFFFSFLFYFPLPFLRLFPSLLLSPFRYHSLLAFLTLKAREIRAYGYELLNGVSEDVGVLFSRTMNA